MRDFSKPSRPTWRARQAPRRVVVIRATTEPARSPTWFRCSQCCPRARAFPYWSMAKRPNPLPLRAPRVTSAAVFAALRVPYASMDEAPSRAAAGLPAVLALQSFPRPCPTGSACAPSWGCAMSPTPWQSWCGPPRALLVDIELYPSGHQAKLLPRDRGARDGTSMRATDGEARDQRAPRAGNGEHWNGGTCSTVVLARR